MSLMTALVRIATMRWTRLAICKLTRLTSPRLSLRCKNPQLLLQMVSILSLSKKYGPMCDVWRNAQVMVPLLMKAWTTPVNFSRTLTLNLAL